MVVLDNQRLLTDRPRLTIILPSGCAIFAARWFRLMTRFLSCVLFLFLWATQPLLLAQSPLELTKISIEQGLPQGYVVSVCQDRDGFIWLGTNNGLCRYDGYEFLVFLHDPYDPFSISHNGILHIAEAGEFLCVLTYTGIDLLDRQTRRFYHFSSKAAYLLSDGDSTLYIFERKIPIRRLVLTTEVSARIRSAGPQQPQQLLEDLPEETVCREVTISGDGRALWLLKPNQREVYRLDIASSQIQRFTVPGQDTVEYLANDGANGAWLGNPYLLAHLNPTRPDAPWHLIRPERPLNTLRHFDWHKQWLWLGMDEMCAFRFDLQHLPQTIGPKQAQLRLEIPEGVVSSMTDQFGIVWFGTNAHGIRQFNPRAAAFKNYLPGLSIYSPPFTDAQGDVWLGRINQPVFKNHLFNRLNLTTGRLVPYPFAAAAKDLAALYTVADDAGDLWTSGQNKQKPEGQLIYYQPSSGRTEVFPYTVDPQHYFDVLALRYEAPDAIWIYLPYRMLRFDRKARQFTAYDYSQLGVGEPRVMGVAVTADGSKWIALTKSIVRAQPDGVGNYRFSTLQNDPANRNSLPANNIKCLLTDPTDAHILWIGTSGSGLCRLDTRTGQFTHFNTRNGLSDDVVYGIVATIPSAGRGFVLWLSTNKGLNKFDPATGRFQCFLQSDGLPGNEFNTYAYGKMPDGRLVFGGVNGLTIFDPNDLSVNAKPPQVRLTALHVNGRLVDPRDAASLLTRGIEFTESLELGHAQNNLLLQFAALDYAKPQRNQFQFYLEGAEPEWAHRGFEHTAQYLNLAPGTYLFKVKAANSDGIWNDVPATLRIVIHPPWWASWWAYALYLLLAAGAAYGFYQIQLRRRLDHAETMRLQELDQVKTRLYTNITHEFRTPLTVILGVTEQVKHYLTQHQAQAQASLLETVQRNGSQLLQLINQLLDLSKLEAGSMRLQLQHGDVVIFIKYITESFHSYATGRGVQLHFLTDALTVEMDYDAEKFQMIVANLLSNAIKFTPSGGHVYVQVKEVEQKSKTWLSLRVKDTGVGIAPEKLPYVFDRFYQADDTSTRNSGGTGIGLALVRELARLMQGDISVSSKPGEGAVFTVMLPVASRSEAGVLVMPANPSALPTFSPAHEPMPLPVREPATGSDNLPLVLIVEDHADVADYVVACVQDHYQTMLALNGQAGIERALETIPDLIISDVMMPEKDGFEVCQILKNNECTSHIPIVLLTAKASVEDRIAGLRRGADAYLAKPFHPDELRAVLANLLEVRQKLQAKYASGGGSADTQASQPPNPPTTEFSNPEDIFLQKLRAAVETRLSDSTLTSEDVCRSLGMSYPVVYRKLSALTGRSLNVYIRLVRLQNARNLLRSTTLSVSEIAYEVGFNDPKFFSRVFSEEFGEPPSAFRQNEV